MAAKQQSPSLDDLIPDLVATTVLDIEGSDVNYPRIKISHPNHDFVSAVWSRSSASAWSRVSRYAVRSSPVDRAAMNWSNSAVLCDARGVLTSASIPRPTRWLPRKVAPR